MLSGKTEYFEETNLSIKSPKIFFEKLSILSGIYVSFGSVKMTMRKISRIMFGSVFHFFKFSYPLTNNLDPFSFPDFL